jgi:hypothetical protein
MAINVASPDVKSVALTTFSGLCTNINPVALPQGSSPDNSDCSFLPSGVFSRACLQKAFASSLGVFTFTYGKSYVDPSGIIRDFWLDSTGQFWMEIISPSNLAAAPTVIFTTTPGSYARSITANGREYVAIHNGLQGADIPYQITGLPDGTVQIDRVTQDAPGAPPTVANLILPPSSVAASGSPIALTIGSYGIQGANLDPTGTFYQSIYFWTSSSISGVEVGQSVVISGTTNFNGTFGPITAVYPGAQNLVEVSGAYIPAGTPFETSGTVTIQQGALQRSSNIVTGATTSPHGLQQGYQVQITNALAGPIGTGVSSIVINNENAAGIATVTVNLATGQLTHGLIPGLFVAIFGVQGVTVGTSVTSIIRAGQVVTVVFSAGTGLTPGALINVSGVTPSSFNAIVQVATVTTTTNTADTITYPQVDVDATGGGSPQVDLEWPIPQTATPTLYEVLSAPTATSFQVQLDYSDATFTTGSVSLAWDGTFDVLSVPTPETFTYQQYGPDASASPIGGGTIMATPVGQIAPGQRQAVVFFINRQGGVTGYSPPLSLVTPGGQYLSVTNIPVGPPNTVARVVAFTGADGAYFFYIPSPPQVNGQVVGTATQINDNVTTSAVFDFGDPTLFAAIGISIPGNNLANQIVLDGALNFGYYASRLLTIGQRNTVQSLLNMGFDGGYFQPIPQNAGSFVVGASYVITSVGSTNFVPIGASANTVGVRFYATGAGSGTGTATPSPTPTGWAYGGTNGRLIPNGGRASLGAWSINVTPSAHCGVLSQSAYEDPTGAPIIEGNTLYTIRVYLQPTVAAADLAFTAALTSSSTGFSSTATISGSLMNTAGSWLQANFSQRTPTAVPSDLTLSVYASSSATPLTLLVDELSLIYEAQPTLTGGFGSYVNNPEAFDGVTGLFAPDDDTHQLMGMFIIRSALYMLTLDPNGRLHETSQGDTEPAEWIIGEVASNCGLVGVAALTQSQADDSTASGGEEWESWYSSDGPRIFGGSTPDKIAQEIQRPAGQAFPGAPPDLGAVNVAAQLTTWALNDPNSKTLYFGVPANSATAPSVIWQMSYLGMDSAEQIANSPPVHRALSGKLVTSDLARKWSPWQRAMNGAALMFRQPNVVQPVFFNGNGLTPNTSAAAAYGNVYILNANMYTDDDYGQFSPYYTTYAFVDRDQEQQLDLGGGLKTVSYSFTTIAGVGLLTPQLLYNFLNQPWSIQGQSGTGSQYPLSLLPTGDLEWSGLMAQGYRFFYKVAPIPNPAGSTAKPTTDVKFSLSSFTLCLRKKSRGGSVSGRYVPGPV